MELEFTLLAKTSFTYKVLKSTFAILSSILNLAQATKSIVSKIILALPMIILSQQTVAEGYHFVGVEGSSIQNIGKLVFQQLCIEQQLNCDVEMLPAPRAERVWHHRTWALCEQQMPQMPVRPPQMTQSADRSKS